MANELTYHSAANSGDTLYAMRENNIGQVWNGSAYETPASASWATYAITMTEATTSTGIFRGTNPSGSEGGSFIVRQQVGGSPAVTDPVLASAEVIADVYHADCTITMDSATGSGQDEYQVHWFVNGIPVTSGITTPLIQVLERDGTEKIASQAMTAGAVGILSFNEATLRIDKGQAVVVFATAVIGGITQKWRQTVGRDKGNAQ